MKILICDDSKTVRKRLMSDLSLLLPCTFLEASDGNQAIELYKSDTPDLVFMDILMPEKDGLSALSEIKTFNPQSKVIMLSSVGTKSNLRKALALGADDFIQKPFDKNSLSHILSGLMKGDL